MHEATLDHEEQDSERDRDHGRAARPIKRTSAEVTFAVHFMRNSSRNFDGMNKKCAASRGSRRRWSSGKPSDLPRLRSHGVVSWFRGEASKKQDRRGKKSFLQPGEDCRKESAGRMRTLINAGVRSEGVHANARRKVHLADRDAQEPQPPGWQPEGGKYFAARPGQIAERQREVTGAMSDAVFALPTWIVSKQMSQFLWQTSSSAEKSPPAALCSAKCRYQRIQDFDRRLGSSPK